MFWGVFLGVPIPSQKLVLVSQAKNPPQGRYFRQRVQARRGGDRQWSEFACFQEFARRYALSAQGCRLL